jgi:lipopolysaccharide export system permease protein
MQILDKYLIRQFLYALLFSLIACWVIVFVVDLVEHLDNFIDRHATLLTIIKYYFYYTPYIIALFLPVAMLLSTLFSLGQLAKHNELLAMKSAGISLYRILSPLFVLGFLISLVTVVFGGLVVPFTFQKMMAVKTVEIERESTEKNFLLHNIFVQGGDDRIFHLDVYNSKEKTGSGVLVQKFENNRLKEEIQAKKISWTGNGWLFEDGRERIFTDSLSETESQKESAPSESTVSIEQPGIEKYETFDRLLRLDLNIKPEAFAQRQKKPEEMGYFELSDYVNVKKRSGQDVAKETTELYLKISFPFVNFIIVLFGAPIAANPKRSGIAIGFAISLFISFMYYFLVRMGQSFGYSGKLSPLFAAWSANILFFILGVVLLIKAKK